jgi:hypothetical protein
VAALVAAPVSPLSSSSPPQPAIGTAIAAPIAANATNRLVESIRTSAVVVDA